MFKVTCIKPDRQQTRTTLRLEGRLTRDSLGEFARACRAFHGRWDQLHLDLSGITFLDDAAVIDLRRLMRDQVHVTGGSSFVRELLEETNP